MSGQQSCIKKTKNSNSKNKIVFCSKCNPLVLNIQNIIQWHSHILDNCKVMQNKQIMVACQSKKKMKELPTRVDPYSIINNVYDEMHMFHCKKRCDLCANFVVAKSSFECFTTKIVYKVWRSTSCVSKNVIYISFCLNCLKQVVGSTIET